MAVTRAWKVYGLPGHRQRESFFESVKYDFSVAGDVRILTRLVPMSTRSSESLETLLQKRKVNFGVSYTMELSKTPILE